MPTLEGTKVSRHTQRKALFALCWLTAKSFTTQIISLWGGAEIGGEEVMMCEECASHLALLQSYQTSLAKPDNTPNGFAQDP